MSPQPKNISCVLLLIVIASAATGCDSGATKGSDVSQNPVSSTTSGDDTLYFREHVADLGVLQSPNVEHEFEFTNRGSDVIRITDVVSTCSCTVATLRDKVIAPMESGAIQAAMDLEGRRAGAQRFEIRVSYEVADAPHEIVLAIHSEYRPPVEVAPKELQVAVFGSESVTATIKIVSSGERAIPVASVRPSVSWISAQATGQPEVLFDRWVQSFDVRVNPPDGELGGRREAISFTLSPDTTLTVPVMVEIAPRVLVLPKMARMRVDPQSPGQAVAELFVRDRGGAAIEIDSIEVQSGPEVMSDFERTPKARHKIRVSTLLDGQNEFSIELLVRIAKPCQQESVVTLLSPPAS